MKLTEIGKSIKTYRKKYGMETKEFAELCEIPHNQIKNYESGITTPKHKALISICRELQLDQYTTDELLLEVMPKVDRIELLVSQYFLNEISTKEIAVRVECSEALVIKTINNSEKNVFKIKIKQPEFESTERIELPGMGVSICHFSGGTIGDWNNMSELEKQKYN
tara:strand:+ start:1596 stop:2093 length:498 start_codon:yes stop_codon:yes gene_type:complete